MEERFKVYFEDAVTGEWYGRYYTDYQFREGQVLSGIVPDKKVLVKEVILEVSQVVVQTVKPSYDKIAVEQCVRVVTL